MIAPAGVWLAAELIGAGAWDATKEGSRIGFPHSLHGCRLPLN